MKTSRISIIPIEVIQDHRLTLMQTRVLTALFSFRGRTTNLVFPSREKLAVRCGYSIASISRVTGQLEKLGWLLKEGKGGRKKATRYHIITPELIKETVTEPETVAEVETVSEPDTKTVTEPDTLQGLNRDRTGYTHVTNHNNNIPINKPIDKKPKEPKSKKTWIAYANAYQSRYGHEPLRNVKVNSLLCKFVDDVGINDAPLIAQYYLSLNHNWYQTKFHDIATLLQNSQAIRTQWINQTNNTSVEHRRTEQTSSRLNTHNEVIRAIQAGEV